MNSSNTPEENSVSKSKPKKKKLELVENSLDNSAPVEKLIEDLPNVNEKANYFYLHILKQRRATTSTKYFRNLHYTITGHPLNTFPDDWDGEIDQQYFEAFTYKSTLPKMITRIKYIQKDDPVTSVLKKKHDWNLELLILKKATMRAHAMKKFETLNEEVVRCPKYIVDIAALLEKEPDVNFNSSYNWYYAGNGNLQLICIDWIDYLLYSEFNILYLSQFYKDNLTIKLEDTITFDCGEGNNILETVYSSEKVIALRTMYKIFLLKINLSSENMQIDKIGTIESEIPFVGINFDGYHKNILYITSLDNKLQIINLDRCMKKTILLKRKTKSLLNNWNTVIGSERTYFTHASSKAITIFDKRTKQKMHVWKDVRNLTDDPSCNDISAVRQREGIPSLYLATDHHLFQMDLRNVKDEKPRPIRRWTHGMQCIPTYISVCDFEIDKELIMLSSQWCEDMCVLGNYNFDTSVNSMAIPYRPPSIFETLKEARNKMLLLDLNYALEKRLSTAITGCLVLEQGEKYAALVQNSFGDISSHILYPEHLGTFMEEDSPQSLHDWSQNLCDQEKELEVTSVVNIANVWKNLERVPDNHRFVEDQTHKIKKSNFSEKEIFEAFDNEELDEELLDVWQQERDISKAEQSSIDLDLHYSDNE